ncbi:MAG: IclR family transcriptional regulator [Gammaproteobacteria bacterium]|nr:IclR family transcriptional regulator [Gammaproteobacteria bacterium]MCP5199768.1 IclR family transcriptional regulator [Gammaproteobacteria bacterium]
MATIDKALDALFLLGQAGQALRLADIARSLDMPRSSAHRILAPLVARGLLERDAHGRYQAGLGLMTLGLACARREPIAHAAQPVLEAAAHELGETFFLVVARGGRLVVLEKAEGDGFLRAAPRLGSSVPVHATAVGKLYLAHAPDAVELEALPRYTPATLRSRTALAAAVAEARSRGWAVNDEEWQAGLCVAAAPVLVGGRLEGCVALALVAARFHALGTAAAVRRVRHAAEGIALRLEGEKS